MKSLKVALNAGPLILQFIAVILYVLSLVVPRWLALSAFRISDRLIVFFGHILKVPCDQNDSGTLLHPHSRSWGLLYVVGRTRRLHTTQWTIACSSVGKFVTLGCDSPLCKWYTQKCAAFRVITIISYTVLCLVSLAILLNILSCILSLRHSKKTLKYSVGLAFLSAFFSIVSVFVYIYGMDQAFAMINAVGYYPVPQPAMSFVLFCVGIFLTILAFIFHCIQLHRISREANYIHQAKSEVKRIRSEYQS